MSVSHADGVFLEMRRSYFKVNGSNYLSQQTTTTATSTTRHVEKSAVALQDPLFPQSGGNYTVNLSCKNFLLEEGREYYSCLNMQTQQQQQHTQYIFYKGGELSLGLIGAAASALTLSWSFVSCFYLILFFHYSAKHIAPGCDTVDLSLQLSTAKSGR